MLSVSPEGRPHLLDLGRSIQRCPTSRGRRLLITSFHAAKDESQRKPQIELLGISLQ
jgi:hypothetical protein